MSVRRDGERIRLEGDCHVEDAEPLLALLMENPGLSADLSACTRLHTAVAQVLLAFAPALEGESPDPFVRERVAPALERLRDHLGRPAHREAGLSGRIDTDPTSAHSRPSRNSGTAEILESGE